MIRMTRMTRLLLLLALLAPYCAGQTITTVAGGGTGDGNAATQAFLSFPYGLAFDLNGNLLIADQNDHRIRKVTPGGIISTFAGTGVGAYADGPAAQAQFNFPAAIRVDGAGNVYVPEVINRRVRKIDTSGIVSTIAGSGELGDPAGATSALTAKFRTPFGLAVDSSGTNVYVSDGSSNRVMKVNPQSGTISAIAGTGAPGFGGDGGAANVAQLSFPAGLAVDSGGQLYIADSSNGRIRKVDSNGTISTYAGCRPITSSSCQAQVIPLNSPKPATQIGLANPVEVVVGPDGNLYIVDTPTTSNISLIHRVDQAGMAVTVATLAPGQSSGVAVDSQGQIYVADSLNRRVTKFAVAADPAPTVFAGGAFLDNVQATATGLTTPSSVRVDPFGNFLIADAGQNVIRRVDSSGVIRRVAGNRLGAFSGDNGPATSASINLVCVFSGTNPPPPFFSTGVAFDGNSNMYIADTGNHRIRKVTPDGTITTFAGSGTSGFSGDAGAATSARLSCPTAVAVDSAGSVYIADRLNRRIRKVDTNGAISTFAGNGATTLCNSISLSCGDNGPATSASFADPRDLTFDSQDNLYVVDGFLTSQSGQAIGGFKIRQIDTGGRITTVAGNGTADASGDFGPPLAAGLGFPSGIVLDRNSGTIFVSDERHHRIRRIGSTVSTLAGTTVNNSEAGYSGDGGPASAAQLRGPRGLAIDRGGNLLLADTGNSRIRQICCVASQAARQLALVSGSPQTVPLAQSPQDLKVQIRDGVTPVAGITVTFTANPAGAVAFTPSSGQVTTGDDGTASIKLAFPDDAAQRRAGRITITASSTGLNSVTFIVNALPVLGVGGAVNGASFTGGASAAGTIVSLFGQGIASSVAGAVTLPLPNKLANDSQVQVQAGARTLLAPLFFVSPLQANFLMPFEITDPTVNLVLATGALDSPDRVQSAPLQVSMAESAPGVFTLNQQGTGSAAVLHADFAPVTPANPAKAGEILLFFATGLGAVEPAITSGVQASCDPVCSTTKNRVDVTIGGQAAEVGFSGLAPGFAGLYQINAKAPAGLAAGPAVQVVVKVTSLAGSKNSNTVTIAVGN